MWASVILVQVWVFVCCRGVFNTDTTHPCRPRGVKLPWDPAPAPLHPTTADGAFQIFMRINKTFSQQVMLQMHLCGTVFSLGLGEHIKLSILASELHLQLKIGLSAPIAVFCCLTKNTFTILVGSFNLYCLQESTYCPLYTFLLLALLEVQL